MPGVRIDFQDRPVVGARHPRHERRDDVAAEVLQPVEGGAGDEGLLVAEGQEDRRLDIGQAAIKVLRVILLQLRHHGVDVEDEDVGPLLQLLRIALGQADTLFGMQPRILAVVHEVAALAAADHAGDRIALLEVVEVADVLVRPGDFAREDLRRSPDVLPLVEVAREGGIEQLCGLARRDRHLARILLESRGRFEHQALHRVRPRQRIAQDELAAQRMTEIGRLLDLELVDDEVIDHLAHVLHGARRALVEIARTGHAVMRQVRRDHAQAAAQRVLHDVAVMAGERALAVDDDENLRILVGAVVLVHVADLPGGALGILGVGVLHRIRDR